LAHEKELTPRPRTIGRRAPERLPWVKVDKPYVFDGPAGKQTLADLFAGRSQLVVQHFMFAPDWAEGCKSCSVLGRRVRAHDPASRRAAIPRWWRYRGPRLRSFAAFKARMGWTFGWLSSGKAISISTMRSPSPRNRLASGAKVYNFETSGFGVEEAPASACFIATKPATSSTPIRAFARGLDMMNAAYHYLDLTPLGRHEEGLPYPMDWLRLRDAYKPASGAATCCQS